MGGAHAMNRAVIWYWHTYPHCRDVSHAALQLHETQHELGFAHSQCSHGGSGHVLQALRVGPRDVLQRHQVVHGGLRGLPHQVTHTEGDTTGKKTSHRSTTHTSKHIFAHTHTLKRAREHTHTHTHKLHLPLPDLLPVAITPLAPFSSSNRMWNRSCHGCTHAQAHIVTTQTRPKTGAEEAQTTRQDKARMGEGVGFTPISSR